MASNAMAIEAAGWLRRHRLAEAYALRLVPPIAAVDHTPEEVVDWDDRYARAYSAFMAQWREKPQTRHLA